MPTFMEGQDATRPADEQAQLLESRLKEASERVECGRGLVREWEPVAQSCRAGLEALKMAQQDTPMPSPPDKSPGW